MTSDLMRFDGSSRNRPNGFSLVECLVVVALLGILATLAIPSSSVVQRRLDLDNCLRRLRMLSSSTVCSPFTWLGLRLSPRLIVRCR